MTLQIQPQTAPIVIDKDGAARVGGTRVLLDVIVEAFLDGDSPEQIHGSYDAITLADVYGVITYYLNHREEVDDYMRHVEEESERIRRRMEAEHPEMFRAAKTLSGFKAVEILALKCFSSRTKTSITTSCSLCGVLIERLMSCACRIWRFIKRMILSCSNGRHKMGVSF